MPPALLIIDLQNDFVSPSGVLKDKHIPIAELLTHLSSACAIFKAHGWPIVAIRSEYLDTQIKPDSQKPVRYLSRPPGDKCRDVPTNDEHLSGTHTGKRKFCAPGSTGAAFPAAVQELVSAYGDTIITEGWFSAFTETELHAWVVEKQKSKPALCTSQVRVIRECMAATSPSLSQDAFQKIERCYGQVLGIDAIFSTAAASAAEPADPHRTLCWVSGSIPSWRVMLCLASGKLAYTRRRLHVVSTPKETRSAEFAAINPRCKTLVLIDEDGTVVIESMAILYYETTLQRFHESENLHNVFEDIELLCLPRWKETSNRERIVDAYRNTLAELAFWEGYLKTNEFVAGKVFSLADCAFYPCLAYLVHRGLDLDKEEFGMLKTYYERVEEMSCAIEALSVKYETVGKNLFLRIYEIAGGSSKE
ncbi:hypothetical protein AOQ84DRAFT_221225 [Glonium stellatum]|uniref:Uncharacterized protein n=1 Tax=Glonium stellatum TaxID=574774 RepID=A0A8E2F2U3_9PEZI|nr:hypothetical protein AOQ84DRAFT_221225 [Glonium stellatum]